MATFRNRHGKWQARVQRKGQQPVSKSFQSKEDAQRWARQIESDIDKGSYTSQVLADKSLIKDVIARYVEEVTLKTRSIREDTYRLKALAKAGRSEKSLMFRYLTDIGNHCEMFYKQLKTRGRPPRDMQS